METNELKEYLGIVVDMEKNIYLQKEMIGKLQKEISHLGIANTYEKPQLPELSGAKSAGNIAASLIALILSFLAVAWGVSLITSGVILYFLFALVVFAAAIAAFICGIIGIREGISDSGRAKKQAVNAQRAYVEAQDRYEKDSAADKKRINKELKQKAVLTAELNQLINANTASERVLAEIYNKNIIFPKYRNLVMVCSLYEYICSGRCSALEGHEGAYNILETEMRLDRIITQLDMVIDRLDSIKQNQYILYSTIKESNNKCEQIIYSANNIAASINSFRGETAALNAQIAELQKSSALTAYTTERVRQEMHYMNRMNYLSGRNDAVFFNTPPA